MAYHPDIPTPTGVVQDELAQMRENFQHLAPLAQAVDELQTVSGLAPYIQAILGSRIVDHNLDVPNPPNGYYVRLDNGLQVCMRLWNQHPFEGTTRLVRDASVIWQYPAAFTQLLFAIASGYPAYWGAPGSDKLDYGGITLSPADNDISPSLALTSIRIRYFYHIYGGRLDLMALAIGRWK